MTGNYEGADLCARLVLEVSWESGIAGGGIGQTTRIGPQRVFVDATRGSFFTVAGSNSLTIPQMSEKGETP